MAKVLFEKIFQVALKKKKKTKKFPKFTRCGSTLWKERKIQNPPERIKIASKEKYFQSPSFESKKKNSKLLLLPWKKIFFKIFFL